VGPLEVVTRSAEETRALGLRLGALLQTGDFVALSGELGAGKTQLARGIAEGAGVSAADVSSPTFSIVQSYAGRSVTLHHSDFYRLRGEDELFATGFYDLEGAMLVEWIDLVPTALPSGESLRVELEVVDSDSRRIRGVAHGERHQRLLEAWLGGS
jgi:tRNA threonylcarbamoyladenosine biosynthesis protein TsaE